MSTEFFLLVTNIVVIRHGQSLGNVIDMEIKCGNFKHCTPELIANGDPYWPLSELGRQQARQAGEYLRERFPKGFERVFCSPYVRAQQTLANLDVGEAVLEPLLQEQDWGRLVGKDIIHNLLAHVDFDRRYPFDVHLRPPDGETVAEVHDRIERFWERELSNCQGKNVLIVTHWVPMFLSRLRFNEICLSDFYPAYHTKRKIFNCQIDTYSDVYSIDTLSELRVTWNQSTCLHSDRSSEYPWQRIVL